MRAKSLSAILAVLLALLTVHTTFADSGIGFSPFIFSPFIIGGVAVSAGDPIASSTVLLIGTLNIGEPGDIEYYACSGTIISEDTLVTAAHCVAEELLAPADPTQFLVMFTTSVSPYFRVPYAKLAANPATHTIYGYEFNPGWKGTDNGAVTGNDINDIAVIRFKGGLPSGYAPATLLPSSLQVAVGDTVTLAGYGTTYGTDSLGRTVGTLRKVDVTVEQLIGTQEVEVDQTGGKGSCSGDSGGPAFLTVNGTMYLWGATSRGDAACAQNGIYTNITAYTDFIAQAQKDLESLQ